MNDGYRHSMCKNCWRKRRPGRSSAGHETMPSRRPSEICCFCLEKHKSGILVANNPNSKELRCGGQHVL
jgi:hypothetical protein